MRALGPLSSCLLLLALASPLASQEAQGGSTRTGVYSQAQARRGRTLYYRVCVDCHELDDFKSNEFLGDYVGGTVYDLYQYLVESMPDDSPGSRSDEEYAASVAFILQQIGFPPGEAELTPDAARLKAIKFESPAKDGSETRH